MSRQEAENQENLALHRSRTRDSIGEDGLLNWKNGTSTKSVHRSSGKCDTSEATSEMVARTDSINVHIVAESWHTEGRASAHIQHRGNMSQLQDMAYAMASNSNSC